MSNPKTLTIFPAVHSSAATEFRLNQARGFRNLRIAGLGAVTTGAAASYTDAAGVYGLIQRIAIYDGGILLDELMDAHAVLAFRNLMRGAGGRDNGLDWSLMSALTCSSRSWQMGMDGGRMRKCDHRNLYATLDAATTAQGWLALPAALNLAARMPYWDTRAFANLRIVIEWRTDPNLAFAGNTAAVLTATPLSPILLADAMNDADIAAAGPVPAVSYTRMIQERVGVPAVAVAPGPGVTAPQDYPVRLLAPAGRVVNRLLMAAVRTDAPAAIEVAYDCLKADSSEVYAGEILQLTCNGEMLLPYSGLDTWSRRQHHLVQAWGDLHVPIGSGYMAWENDVPADAYNILDDPTTYYAEFFEPFTVADAIAPNFGYPAGGSSVSMLGYTGLIIGRRVSSLQLRYQRTLTQRRAGGVTLSFWYEVPAVITGIDPAKPSLYTAAFV